MIVLDTHTWIIWRTAPERLGRRAAAAIEAASEIGVPAVSAWEISTLVRRRRIALDRDTGTWVRQALAGDRVVELPLTAEIAVRAGELDEEFTGDPADRIIYATALAADAQLVTRDALITGYDPRRAVW